MTVTTAIVTPEAQTVTNDQLRHIDARLCAVDQAGAVHKSYEYADVFWELEAWRLLPAHAWESSEQHQPVKPLLSFLSMGARIQIAFSPGVTR